MTFTYVSLFSGIGGFETALNRLGGRCVMASEIDKYANKAYEVLYGTKTAGDITKIDATDVPDHDLLTAGFPCQAFSVAGKRLGFEDTRGTLFFEIARIAKEKRPKVLLLENVKGLIGHNNGNTIETIVRVLNDIGYTVDFQVLNSKYFGVPQNRERVLFVCVLDDLVDREPWRIEGTNVMAKAKKRLSRISGIKTFNFDWPPQMEVTTRLRDVLEDHVPEKYYLSEEKTAKLLAQLRDRELDILRNRKPNDINAIYSPDIITKNQNGRRVKPADDVMCALTVKDRHGIVEPRIEQFTLGEGVSCCIDANYTKGTAPGDVGKGRRTHLIEVESALIHDRGFETRKDDISHCLRGSEGGSSRAIILEKPRYRIRKLTPLECFRLQGFPDAYYYALKNAGISDSQLYKMAGNAVTVNVVEAIGERLLPLLDRQPSSGAA